MSFDSTINLGQIISLLALLLIGIGGYVKIRTDITELKTMVRPMWERFIKTNKNPSDP